MLTGKLLRLARIKRLMDKYAEDLEDVYQALAVVKVGLTIEFTSNCVVVHL